MHNRVVCPANTLSYSKSILRLADRVAETGWHSSNCDQGKSVLIGGFVCQGVDFVLLDIDLWANFTYWPPTHHSYLGLLSPAPGPGTIGQCIGGPEAKPVTRSRSVRRHGRVGSHHFHLAVQVRPVLAVCRNCHSLSGSYCDVRTKVFALGDWWPWLLSPALPIKPSPLPSGSTRER